MLEEKTEFLSEHEKLKEGSYTIRSCIRRSYFSNVYVADENIRLDRKIIIKEFAPKEKIDRTVTMICKGNDRYEKLKDAFGKECKVTQAVGKIKGINRCMKDYYIDSFCEKETMYLVLRQIGDLNLKEFVNKQNHGNGLALSDFKVYANSLLKFARLLHCNDIIHGDISPDNIIVLDKAELVFIDYGNTQLLGEVRKDSYTAPELYRENAAVGTWNDIYSIGSTMYFMACGRKLEKSTRRQTNELFDLPQGFPYKKILEKCLNLDYKKRYKTVNEIYIDFFLHHPSVIRCAQISGIVAVVLLVSIFSRSLTSGGGGKNTEANATKETSTETSTETGIETSIETLRPDHDGIQYVVENNEVIIIGCSAEVTNPNIPQTIGGLPVRSIRGLNKNVTTLTVPEGVERIEEFAFENYEYLEAITLPDSIDYIDSYAFKNNFSLHEINISGTNQNYYFNNNQLLRRSDGEVIIDIN